MAKKKIIAFLLLLALVFMQEPKAAVYAMNTEDHHYTYDFWGAVLKSIPAFELAYTIDGNTMDITVSGLDDVATGGGRVFLIDTQESRLHVFDEEFSYVTSVKLLRNE